MCFEMGHSAGCLCNNSGREKSKAQGYNPVSEHGKLRLIPANEPRNICWNCGKLFSEDPKHFLPKEVGQKQYLSCNHCGKVNHL
jgi:DNA-directed RNA polymerase subunit RPC12/RpoP